MLIELPAGGFMPVKGTTQVTGIAAEESGGFELLRINRAEQ